MRLHIIFSTEDKIILPWDYPHLLHGFIYRAIAKAKPKLGEFLHDQGFVAGTHRYKMITFSLLHSEKAKARKDGLEIHPPIHWWTSSPLSAPMEALAISLISDLYVSLRDVVLKAEKIEVEKVPSFSGRALFETISPIVVSTGVVREGKMHRIFLSPREPDFWRIVEDNLKRKWLALWGKELKDGVINFEPVGEWKSKLFTVQGLQIKGYVGRFYAEGDERLLLLGYEAGLGERNAQGFGMIRFIK